MLGRAGQNWNPNVRSRIRSEKNATVLCRDPQGRRWLAWNADEYKEKMHRAWGAEPGAEGIPCRDCGCRHSYVVKTERVGEIMRRLRRCRNCGRVFFTTEGA